MSKPWITRLLFVFAAILFASALIAGPKRIHRPRARPHPARITTPPPAAKPRCSAVAPERNGRPLLGIRWASLPQGMIVPGEYCLESSTALTKTISVPVYEGDPL